ncbi:hypothetical protein [Pedobacter ureilyticus]|uniref:Uncharacterized protein n=1 Tax=Pedobacter ureilyticus TaxID=1393051 RepID=A0ABW9J1C7_9SPHI|nr:hypothetical protein [Pedobacter helvus]
MKTSMVNPLESLYFLESADFYLVEIKRNDLDEQAPISDKFKWLKIEKHALAITELTFSSMDSSLEIEERYFKEGFLKFNKEDGTFIEKYNLAQYALQNRSNEELPNELWILIKAMLIKTAV